MKKTNSQNPKKTLTVSKITVSIFSRASVNSAGKNQVKNDSVSCMPTTSSALV